jgi:hypothetical protein
MAEEKLKKDRAQVRRLNLFRTLLSRTSVHATKFEVTTTAG